MSDWISCEDRLPISSDADCMGNVWAYSKGLGVVVINRNDFAEPIFYTHWMPTGLTKPEPPQ